MTNYSSQFATAVPYKTEEQRQWLRSELANPREVVEVLRDPNFPHDIDGPDEGEEWEFPRHVDDTQAKEFFFTEWETGRSGDHLAVLVYVYELKFHVFTDEPWTLEIAHTCDRPRTDGFGGSAYCIYRGRAHFTSTYMAIEDWVNAQEKNDQIIDRWQHAYQGEE